MSVFFTADSCDSLGLCIPDGMLRVFFENSFILRVRSRARPKLKLRVWSTGEGCFNNRSQRPQPCDLHGEDLERERSAELSTLRRLRGSFLHFVAELLRRCYYP